MNYSPALSRDRVSSGPVSRSAWLALAESSKTKYSIRLGEMCLYLIYDRTAPTDSLALRNARNQMNECMDEWMDRYYSPLHCNGEILTLRVNDELLGHFSNQASALGSDGSRRDRETHWCITVVSLTNP